MATGGSDNAFGLPSSSSSSRSSKIILEDADTRRESEILNSVFEPPASKPITIETVDSYITDELNRISSNCISEVRDGLLGPEEVKISGAVLYEVDRLGITGRGNFSTVKANVCAYKGKWMYEVLLGSKGLMQLGWCSLNCKFDHSNGVGDTPYSFSYDGNRIRKWNVRTQKYGESWLTGDVITCAIDCDDGVVTFYRNGVSMGAAFENICLGPDRAYFPAVSLSQGESVRLNFGATPFIYPIGGGYRPLEITPLAQLMQSQLLLQYVDRQLPDLIVDAEEENPSNHTTHILLLTHIFEHLVPRIKVPYIMQGAFIPFLKQIVDNQPKMRDVLLVKLIDIMWGLMEDHEIKSCLEYLILGLLTLYRFCNAETYYTPQKAYLYILWRLMKHEASRKYAVKWILFDKMKFPLFIYIKPPDDSILQRIVPTVWWETQHATDPDTLEKNKKAYYDSCEQLHQHVQDLEHLQVAILKELLCNEDRSKGPSTRFLFLHKFRELIKENISDNNVVQIQQCSLPVLLALFHRFVRTLRDIFRERKIATDDIYTPVDRFVNDSLDYFDLQRVGGLKSHLNKVHETAIKDSGILNQVLPSNSALEYGNPAVDKSLIELLDGAVLLYSYGAHKQLQKMSNVLSETVESYITALDDSTDKLSRCPPTSAEVLQELERSRQVFEEKVVEQSRHLSWLIAVINSPEKLEDVAWLFDAVLRTVETATEQSLFFEFMPEFYITVCVDGYMAIKNFFKLSPLPFTSLPNYNELLQRYGTFIARHFADQRIVNIDTKDAVVQSLACFVCYESSLKVLEDLNVELKEAVAKALLAPYENRAWAQTNWILARLWKGNGFGFRFVHLPHLAPAKHQTQEIGAASLQKPCPSKIYQDTIGAVLFADNKLATQFINSVLNQLNWAFSEFVGMIQELQQLSVRTERSFVEMRQLKICATCFDISVGLLRVLEMVTDVASNIFLDCTNPSAEALLARLYQSLCLIMNRVASKANVFETILSLNLPGMETVDHFPIVTAILGILIGLVCKPTDVSTREKSVAVLTREPGFQFELLDSVINSSSSQGQASSSQFADRKQFALRNYKEINSTEMKNAEELISHLIERRSRVDSKSEAGDEDSMCTICYAHQNSVVFDPCKHTSCRPCITQQMLQNKKCFFCMAEISKVYDTDGKELDLC